MGTRLTPAATVVLSFGGYRICGQSPGCRPNNRVTHFGCCIRIGSTSTRVRRGSGDHGGGFYERATRLAVVAARRDCFAQFLYSVRFLLVLAPNFVEDSLLGRGIHSRPKQLNFRDECYRANHTPDPSTHVRDRRQHPGKKPLLLSRVEN